MGKTVSRERELAKPAECVAELARVFPGVVPVRIPVWVSKGKSARDASAEQTMIEFGTAEEVLFVSGLPLDFEDIVRVRTMDGALDITAKIVAMRLHHDQMALAARFLEDVENWIIKA
ncbi:MAG: hypothetical protein ACXV78_02900 [Candidatus Angelobacter sp.]